MKFEPVHDAPVVVTESDPMFYPLLMPFWIKGDKENPWVKAEQECLKREAEVLEWQSDLRAYQASPAYRPWEETDTHKKLAKAIRKRQEADAKYDQIRATAAQVMLARRLREAEELGA